MKLKQSFALFLMAFLALTGCSKEYDIMPDGRAFLDTLDGPDVAGVNDTLYKNALAAEQSGNYKTAAALYQQLSDSEPKNLQFRIKLADAMRRLNDPNNALVQYEWVLTQDPDLIAAREGRALAWMQLGEFAKAQADLEALMRTGVAGWRTFNALGIITAGQQDPAQATAFFNKARAMSPGNPSVLNNMALALGMNQQFESSFATFAQASSLAVSRPQAKQQIDMNSALVYAAAGKLDNAHYIAQQYLSGPQLANNLGFYAHLAKDEQLARTYMNMALTQSKTFYKRAWNNLEALDSERRRARKPEAVAEQQQRHVLGTLMTVADEDQTQTLQPPATAALQSEPEQAEEEATAQSLTTQELNLDPEAMAKTPDGQVVIYHNPNVRAVKPRVAQQIGEMPADHPAGLAPAAGNTEAATTAPVAAETRAPYIPGYVPYTRMGQQQPDRPVVVSESPQASQSTQNQLSPASGETRIISTVRDRDEEASTSERTINSVADFMGSMLDW